MGVDPSWVIGGVVVFVTITHGLLAWTTWRIARMLAAAEQSVFKLRSDLDQQEIKRLKQERDQLQEAGHDVERRQERLEQARDVAGAGDPDGALRLLWGDADGGGAGGGPDPPAGPTA